MLLHEEVQRGHRLLAVGDKVVSLDLQHRSARLECGFRGSANMRFQLLLQVEQVTFGTQEHEAHEALKQLHIGSVAYPISVGLLDLDEVESRLVVVDDVPEELIGVGHGGAWDEHVWVKKVSECDVRIPRSAGHPFGDEVEVLLVGDEHEQCGQFA